MQQLEQNQAATGPGRNGEAQAAVPETLRSPNETLAEMAHDARNMVAALALYCDLLEEPGVLTPTYRHYSGELRLVATACRRLVEKLAAADGGAAQAGMFSSISFKQRAVQGAMEQRPCQIPDAPIQDLRRELLASANLLDAMAGPCIAVSVRADQGARPVRLTCEDLTRVLVNLVKNAAEAIRGAGTIEIHLCERIDAPGAAPRLLLSIEDSGPGFSPGSLETIFTAGFTTRTGDAVEQRRESRPAIHRGLGLSITRAILEAAGGHIRAANGERGGARFEIELPVRTQ